jgi:uncharacterized damage-inducible protein DinB
MSLFTNTAGTALEEGRAYTRALLDLLGDQDPRRVMGEQVQWLRSTVAGRPRAELVRPERPGKWSVGQVLRHLVDTEWVYGYRARKVVAEPGSAIVGYDQDRWAEGLRYADADPGASLEEIALLRGLNLRWLDGLSEEELDRFGEHTERGRESVRHIVKLIGAHDLLHRSQIMRILGAASA